MQNLIKNTVVKNIITAAAFAGVFLFAGATTQAHAAAVAYPTPGVYTYTVPAGVTQIQIEAWGGGGAAGYGEKITDSNSSGFGGGAGGYVKKTVTVNPGDFVVFKVGAGGHGAAGAGGAATSISVNGISFDAGGGGGGLSYAAKYACEGIPGQNGFGPGGGFRGDFGPNCSGGSTVYSSFGGQGGTGVGGDSNLKGGDAGPYAMTPVTQDNPYASSGGNAPGGSIPGGLGGLRGRCGVDGSCPGSDPNSSIAQNGANPGGGGGGSDVGMGGVGGNGEVIITPVDKAPVGFLDVANCTTIAGWSLDQDNPSASVRVDIYADGPAGTGTGIFSANTSFTRADVNGQYNTTGVHGFGLTTPSWLLDGKPHTIYAYGIDLDPSGTNTLLTNAPVTIQCAPATPPATTYLLTVLNIGTVGGVINSNPAGISQCNFKCNANFPAGTTVTLTETPANGGTFVGWTGACASAGSASTCTVVMNSDLDVGFSFTPSAVTTPPAPTSFLLTTTVVGSGNVSSHPLGINCPTACSAFYDTTTVVTLTATPASGFTFTGWSGGVCSGTATTCAVTIGESNVNVTATFTANNVTPPPPTQSTLTVSVVGSGSVTSNPAGINCPSGSCSASYNNGSVVTLTATAASGFTFSGWSGGSCSGTGTCAVTLTANTTVTATFVAVVVTPPKQITLTVNVVGTGTGLVTSTNSNTIHCPTGPCVATYSGVGTVVNLTAAPDSGSTFTGWSGACTGTGDCSITLSADTSVTATFTANTVTPPTQFTLSASVVGSGTVTSDTGGINCPSVMCSALYNTGTVVTLTATPASGFSFNGWSGACSGTSTCVVTVTANTNVTASFVSTGGGGGSLNATCVVGPSSAVYLGSPVTWSANPSGGNAPYTYSWSGDDSLSGTSQSINHSYFTTGNFNAQVIVSSSDGQSVTRTCTVSVLNIPAGGGGGNGGGGGLNQPDVSIINQSSVPGGELASAGVISLTQVPYTGLADYPSWVYFLIGLAIISMFSSAGITIWRKVQFARSN